MGRPRADYRAAGQRFSTTIEYEEVEYDSNQLPRDNEELAWLAGADPAACLRDSTAIVWITELPREF